MRPAQVFRVVREFDVGALEVLRAKLVARVNALAHQVYALAVDVEPDDFHLFGEQ